MIALNCHQSDRHKDAGPADALARRTLLENRSGAAAVEFALLLPMLVLLVIGMVDYAALAYQSMEIYASAHAGADYALKNGWDSAAIQAAVSAATPLAATASPAPQQSKACVTGGVLVVTAGSTCPSGGTPGTYVTVSAQTAFAPIVSWSSLVMPSSLSAQAVVRIQ